LVVLVPVGVAAIVIIAVLRDVGSRRELVVAVVVAALATIGGLVEATTGAIAVGWAWAQLPLVALTLLAGWSIARRVGWADVGIGSSMSVVHGIGRGLRDAALGLALAVPWALGNIANGLFAEDVVSSGWQVVAALRPGVAEEAWARVFVITGLYWLFRRYARAHTAFLVAFAVGTYWFAFLHLPGDPGAALFMAVIQVIPMTYLWLR
jgi:hypothetical protein